MENIFDIDSHCPYLLEPEREGSYSAKTKSGTYVVSEEAFFKLSKIH